MPRSRPVAVVAAAVSVLLLAGCGIRIPADPQGTLDRVEGGVLHAGISPNGDFVRLDGDSPSGSEIYALMVPRRGKVALVDIETAREGCVSLDWKIQDVVVVPVPELPDVVDAITPRGSTA